MKSNYLYQSIHTLSHHPLYVAEHCRILEQDFLELYLRPLTLDEEAITEDIFHLLSERRVTKELSVFVELRVDIDQNQEVVVGDVSLYDGYALRSIQPSAEIVLFDSPFGLYPTSARREALSFAEDLARNLGGEIALECGMDSILRSVDGATIFGVKRGLLVASTTLNRVERDLVIAAAQSLGMRVEEREIMRSDLSEFDEVFGCDHRGVIAISKYSHYRYMSIVAQKIAVAMSQPW